MTQQQIDWLISNFGTTDMCQILGPDVLEGRKSLSVRVTELKGPGAAKHVDRWYKYIPDDILSRIKPLQKSLGRQKAAATSLDRYGEAIPAKLQVFKDKAAATCLKNHGKTNFNKLSPSEIEARFINQYSIQPLEPILTFNNHPPFLARCLKCGNTFECHTSENIVTKCPRCLMRGSTRLEEAIAIALSDAGFRVLPKYRPTWLKSPETGRGLELDIYLPDQNVGFEINGAWSHNSGDTKFSSKPVDYHNWKTSICRDNGVKLFHIWEHWTTYLDCTSYALAKLGVFRTTYQARKLKVRRPSKEDVFSLLNCSHKQGFCSYSYAIGLYDGDTLVQVMTFRKHAEGIEIARNVTIVGAQVIGGIHRLFKHAIADLKSMGYSNIVTYADRDVTPYAEDSVYTRLGFTLIGNTGPSMDYFVHHTTGKFKSNTVVNRRVFQKQFLSDLFSSVPGWQFNPDETEKENLARLDIHPIFNSGCWKFTKAI